MEDLTNIWNADDELNEEQLMNYVKGKLTGDGAHTVERNMAHSPFVNDAVEGLQQFSSAEKINAYQKDINEQLHQKLSEKRSKRKKAIGNLSWEIVAVIVVILLCLLGFVILKMI